MSFRVPHSEFRVAFTLVELMVVVAIIAALVAMLLPSMGKARARARTVVGLSNLRQIGQAVYAYSQSWRDQLPPGFLGSPIVATDWAIILDGMLTNRPQTYDGFFAAWTPGDDERQYTLPMFRDPSAPLPGGRMHFSTNPILMPDITPSGWPTKTLYRVSKLTRTERQLLIFDGAQAPILAGKSYATAWSIDFLGWVNGTEPRWYATGASDNGDPLDRAGPNADGDFEFEGGGDIRYRQDDGRRANVLFCDFHAATTAAGEIRKADIRPDRPG